MAFLTCHTGSASLGRSFCYNIIVPENSDGDIPTVLLLHGLSDDYTQWERMTPIERYANERGIAVIMPDGARSFYTDMKYGDAYYSSIVCDVMRSARSLFPLSVKRKKNFTAGLSMGGYGALKIALKNPDVFSGAISLSGVLNIAKSAVEVTWDRDFTLIWGEDYKSALPGSEDDLFYLTDNIKGEKPRIFISCGDCDFMLGQNRDFHEHIKDAGFDFRYEEHPGNHNWMYWAEHIAEGLDFILGR